MNIDLIRVRMAEKQLRTHNMGPYICVFGSERPLYLDVGQSSPKNINHQLQEWVQAEYWTDLCQNGRETIANPQYGALYLRFRLRKTFVP